MKTILTTAFCAVFSIAVSHADNSAKKSPAVDCSKVLPSFKSEVSANPSFVLQLVERAVRENPSCSCEIVKTAIKATKADSKRVASIVEVVGTSVPEQLRIASQCAVAVAPDSLKEVQAVLSKLDPGAKVAARDSTKGGTDEDTGDETPNPLDFPGSGKDKDVGFGKNAPGSNGSGSSFFTSQFAQVASPATTKNQ
jgi:hypothetical protein